jgi:hypothetical protein
MRNVDYFRYEWKLKRGKRRGTAGFLRISQSLTYETVGFDDYGCEFNG